MIPNDRHANSLSNHFLLSLLSVLDESINYPYFPVTKANIHLLLANKLSETLKGRINWTQSTSVSSSGKQMDGRNRHQTLFESVEK